MEMQSYHHEDLRQELIETGIRYLNKNGYDQFSLRQIARECNVSHTAPYRHFKDKDDLLLAMQNYVEDRFSRILEDSIAGQSETLSMLSFGKAYVEFFAQNPEYYKFIFFREYIQIDWTKGRINEPSSFEPYNIFYREVTKHFAEYNLPQKDYLTGLASMWSVVHGLAGLATMNGMHFDGDWGELTEQVLKGVNPHE